MLMADDTSDLGKPCLHVKPGISGQTRHAATRRPSRHHIGTNIKLAGAVVDCRTEGSRARRAGNRPSGVPVVFFVFPSHHEDMTEAAELIRTGEAARLLGCSRQHVVDLCDEGKLPVVRGGGSSHRYVRRYDVLALTDRSLTRDQEQSRWLHGAIAGRLVSEPDLVLTRARENLDRFSKVHKGTMAEHWLHLWRSTLDSGPDRVLTALVSNTPEAIEMRQNSPFTGILPEEDRKTVLDSFRQCWPHGTRP